MAAYGLAAVANAVAAGWVAGKERWVDAALFVLLALVNGYVAAFGRGLMPWAGRGGERGE